MSFTTCWTDAAFEHNAEKIEDAKWNISNLDDLQSIVRDDFLALCDLLSLGQEMVTTYPMWAQFWVKLDRHQKGKNHRFINGFGWLQKLLKCSEKWAQKAILKNPICNHKTFSLLLFLVLYNVKKLIIVWPYFQHLPDP